MIEFLANGFKFLIEAMTALTLCGLGIFAILLLSQSTSLAFGSSIVVVVAGLVTLFLVLGLSAVMISLRDSQRRSEQLMRDLLQTRTGAAVV